MEQIIEVGGVNVVVHPHPEGQYERLFRKAY
jgi:hypothetical protein